MPYGYDPRSGKPYPITPPMESAPSAAQRRVPQKMKCPPGFHYRKPQNIPRAISYKVRNLSDQYGNTCVKQEANAYTSLAVDRREFRRPVPHGAPGYDRWPEMGLGVDPSPRTSTIVAVGAIFVVAVAANWWVFKDD